MVLLGLLTAMTMQTPALQNPTLKEENGFLRVVYYTGTGTLTLILPDNIEPGDHISGTIFASEKDFKFDDLQIDIGTAHAVSPETNSYRRSWTIPKEGAPRLGVTAWLTTGRSLGTSYIPLSFPKPKPTQFVIPTFMRIGSPFVVRGVFDGDFNNTKLQADELSIPIVAESPRQTVGIVPSNGLPGVQTLQVVEMNQDLKAPCRFLNVNVAVPKVSLVKNEKVELTLSVEGILDLKANESPIIILENHTPKVVDFNGKVKHFVVAKPNSEGNFVQKFLVTSLLTGNFTITANVDPGIGTKIDVK